MWCWTAPRRRRSSRSSAAGRAAFDLIDVLAELHLLDVDAIGLGDLAKRTGYVERQLRRWSTQWKDSKTRELPAIEEVEARLRADVPVQQAVAVAHGDYRFGNCLTDPTAGRIAAVLDWELCTLGDPLADLGYLRVYWADPGCGRVAVSGGRHNDPTGAGGFPSYDELVERYAARTGFDVSRHRVLRRVRLVAAGRHQRRGLRPLPPRRHGRRRLRSGHVPAGHRGAGRGRPGRRAPARPLDDATSAGYQSSGAVPSCGSARGCGP